MTEIFGLLGGVFLAFCGIPQAIKSIREGHSDGISHGMLWLWTLGEILMLIYVLLQYGTSDIWLLLNYGVNVVLTIVIFKYKYWKTKGYTIRKKSLDLQGKV